MFSFHQRWWCFWSENPPPFLPPFPRKPLEVIDVAGGDKVPRKGGPGGQRWLERWKLVGFKRSPFHHFPWAYGHGEYMLVSNHQRYVVPKGDKDPNQKKNCWEFCGKDWKLGL